MESNFVSVVCHVRNDELRISSFLKRMHEQLTARFKQFEIICVDDSSTDETCQAIRRFAAGVDAKTITLIRLSYRQGQECALQAGVDLAIGDFVFEFDSINIDYNEGMIHEAYQTALRGNDVVAVGPARHQTILAWAFYSVFNRVSSVANTMRTESFRVISRRAINRVSEMYEVIPYRKVIYADIGLPSTFISYEPATRTRMVIGRHDQLTRLGTAINTFVLFTDVAYKMAIYVAISIMAGCILLAGYSLVIMMLGLPISPGWTTLMLTLSGATFFIMLMFAISFKYLSILTAMAISRKRYVVHSIEK